jgi:hypothetical protein
MQVPSIHTTQKKLQVPSCTFVDLVRHSGNVLDESVDCIYICAGMLKSNLKLDPNTEDSARCIPPQSPTS